MATGWHMRTDIRLWSAVLGGDAPVRRHNLYHTVTVGSCRICQHHGNAVIVHPITGHAY